MTVALPSTGHRVYHSHIVSYVASTGFWWANLRETDLLADPGVVGRIILRWIFRKWDWIDVAQGSERWRALVNAVMNLRVP
jgi:hypothetical protein